MVRGTAQLLQLNQQPVRLRNLHLAQSARLNQTTKNLNALDSIQFGGIDQGVEREVKRLAEVKQRTQTDARLRSTNQETEGRGGSLTPRGRETTQAMRRHTIWDWLQESACF